MLSFNDHRLCAAKCLWQIMSATTWLPAKSTAVSPSWPQWGSNLFPPLEWHIFENTLETVKWCLGFWFAYLILLQSIFFAENYQILPGAATLEFYWVSVILFWIFTVFVRSPTLKVMKSNLRSIFCIEKSARLHKPKHTWPGFITKGILICHLKFKGFFKTP